MFKIFRKELELGNTKLVMETGKVARQADGAVMVSLGETACCVQRLPHIVQSQVRISFL